MSYKIYLSGPISNTDDFRENFAAAEWLLTSNFNEIVNPLNVQACESKACEPKRGHEHSWECNLKHDILAMLGCDTIFMLPGWERSHGARLELNVATACGLSVRFLSGADLRGAKRVMSSGHVG